MPTTLSAKKRLRQNFTRRDLNRAAKSTVRTQIRKLRGAIADSDVEQSEALFRVATKKLDQAAAKNIFHPNKVARVKSRLSKAIKKLKTGDSE